MTRICLPSKGPLDWRAYLANPGKHWKQKRSAFEAAFSWQLAQKLERRLPKEISAALDTVPCLKDAELLFAVAEHEVTLDTGKSPSQNDVWALLKNANGLISLTIEAKAGESFDKTVSSWLNNDAKKAGRQKRLEWLCNQLKSDASETAVGPIRYQLIHRTVSAILEANRFNAFASVMLVQAFPGADVSYEDFRSFGRYLGVDLLPDRLAQIDGHDAPELHIGWIKSDCCTDKQVKQALMASIKKSL